MIDRIARLLAQAEGASTTAEAEAFFEKAQILAARHSVDLAVARAHQADKTKREVPVTRTVTIGERGKRANASLINLYDAIARANDVSVLIAASNTVVYPTGFPSDIDAVDALWASLAPTMVKFGDALIRDRSAAWRSETVTVWDDREWEYVTKPVSGQGARKAFYSSFTSRIGQRLREARKQAEEQGSQQHFHEDYVDRTVVGQIDGGSTNLPSSMALVLKEKRTEVAQAQSAWYEQRHGKGRKPGSWRGGRSSATWSNSAAAAGRAAADRANLTGRRGIAS